MLKTPRHNNYAYSNKPNLKTHGNITRQAATDGMVLLKNTDNTLPLNSKIRKVAAFGTTSLEIISGGTGSGDVNEAYTISLFDGLTAAGLIPDAGLNKIYESYINSERAKNKKPENVLAALMGAKEPVDEMNVSLELASQMAEKSDVALITIGRNSGEGGDRKAVDGDFYLSATEKDLIKNVTNIFHAKGKKVIVVLNIGGVIETASWNDLPDAILCAWQPGQEAGNSIVDILTGKVNPSGKLAVTFPRSYRDTPTAKNFPGYEVKQEGVSDNSDDLSGFSFMKRTPWEVVYEEDIYVGYRYYNKFKLPVAYEFGYGLSYTNFEYSNLTLSRKDFNGSIIVSVDLTNTGDVEGREIVQVYVSAPSRKLNKPEEELVAFAKTSLLKPGEKETLILTITTDNIVSFDESISTWVADKGAYKVKVGASVNDIKETAKFTLKNEIFGAKVSKALAPIRDIKKMK
jgi:beta-glucosidase